MVQIKKQNIKVLDFADRTVDGYNRSTETAKNCLITSRNIGTVWTERRDPADSIKLQHLYFCMHGPFGPVEVSGLQ